MVRILPLAAAACLALTCSGRAQEKAQLPPPDASKLSDIIAKVEQRPDFRYIREIEWDKDGYDVIYYTTDKAKVEIKYDAVTAQPKAQ